MNIDKYKQVAFLNSTKNTDTALVFASYQPNKAVSVFFVEFKNATCLYLLIFI